MTAIVDQYPVLMIGKVESTSHVDHAGQEIDYTVTVSNTGNIDRKSVVEGNRLVTLTSQSARLEDGHSEVLTGSHVVTQQEIDAGTNMINTAIMTDAKQDTEK